MDTSDRPGRLAVGVLGAGRVAERLFRYRRRRQKRAQQDQDLIDRGDAQRSAVRHDLTHQAGQSRPTRDKNPTGSRRPGRQYEQLFKIRRATFDYWNSAVFFASYLALGLHVESFRAGSRR